MEKQDTEKFCEMLRSFSTAMLITGQPGENLHARPMAIAKVDDAGLFYFLSGKDTLKVHEIVENTRVHVTYQTDRDRYLSIAGFASLTDDPAMIRDLWKEPFKVWFPGGPEDENVVLIAVNPTEAEFWDNTWKNKVQYIWQAATSYVTGTTPDIKEGDQHGVLHP